MSVSRLTEGGTPERGRRYQIPPQSGVGFTLKAGESLRVIDPEGEQVADFICFDAADQREWLSSGRTLDYESTIFLTSGHKLWSNRSRVMAEIVADTVGRHDFLLTPCSSDTFKIIYGNDAPHPSCFGNICGALERFGIQPDDVPTTLNLFMYVDVAPNGRLEVKPPQSKAGDSVEIVARTDLIVGLTACSAEMSNNYRFKPIEFCIH